MNRIYINKPSSVLQFGNNLLKHINVLNFKGLWILFALHQIVNEKVNSLLFLDSLVSVMNASRKALNDERKKKLEALGLYLKCFYFYQETCPFGKKLNNIDYVNI